MKVKKENRGGKRKGAGRPNLYNEKTMTIAFACPISKENEFWTYCTSKLKQWQV